MKRRVNFRWMLVLGIFVASLVGCISPGNQIEFIDTNTTVRLTQSHLRTALSEFRLLLRAYPPRHPYPLDGNVILAVKPILNYSGEDGLPPDLSTILATVISDAGATDEGVPIALTPPRTIREWEVDPYGRMLQSEVRAGLIISGGVTEAEKRISKELSVQMDILFQDREEDGTSGQDAVDNGGEAGKSNEVWTLGLDLHLTNQAGLMVESTSHQVDVVRRGRTQSFGVFFRGSGFGYRARSTIAQGKAHALRIAAQQSIIALLGRHFRVPYWRVVAGSEPDHELISRYRATLQRGEAPADFRLLLFAHGLKVDLTSSTFTNSEIQAIDALRRQLGLPGDTSRLDLAMHLWQTLPYKPDGSPLSRLRDHLRTGRIDQVATGDSAISPDSMIRLICAMKVGQELVLPVYFDYDQSLLSEPAKHKMDVLTEALRTCGLSAWWFDLRGHGGARGEPQRIQKLSEKRAERVREYLEQKHSIPSALIASAGFGTTELITEEPEVKGKHSPNRRVEVILVAGERTSAPPSTEGAATQDSGSEAQTSSLFPPEQWPLPYGVDLPSKLSEATLSTARNAYPGGRLSMSFGYYSIQLSATESDLFSEMTFFFTERAQDPSVRWIDFRCRSGVEEQLRSALSQRFPQGQQEIYQGPAKGWTDADGYNLTVGLERSCLKIEPVT